jgi:two-component system phosphate regulon sensor histidine kinase PhoR
MFHRIRWRIAIPYVILILITMLGLGIYLSYFTRQTYLENLELHQTGQSRLIADSLSTQAGDWTARGDLDQAARHWASLLGTRVTLIARDGRVVGESHEDRALMDNHLDRPEIQQALSEGKGSSTRYSRTVGYEMLYTAVPIESTSGISGFVRISLPLQQVQGDLARLQQTLLGVTILVTGAAVVLAAGIAGRTTGPLRELTAAAEQISRGQLTGRLTPATPDEVGQLTQAFNRMSVQLRGQIEALETERSKIAAVLQEMSDGVLIVDQSGKVQLINPAAERMFTVQAERVLGHSLVEALRYHQIVELWQQCQESGKLEVTSLEIAPMQLYLQIVAAPLGQAMPGSTLFIFQNLTRIRQLETVRRDFISNISHELRTPLASLKALTETLHESALDDPPAARRFLQRMEAEVDALAHMVSELLELARIESGRVPLKLIATRPIDILTKAYDRLEMQAERSGITVTLDCPEGLAPILADQLRLEQVAVNLLHNAIKFTPEGGAITLRAEQRDPDIIFSIQDTGIGIPWIDLPRIFERFYKADRARSSGGTGLGLAIARHLVEAHGGRIWAESQEGRGSTFFFSIPVAQ